MMTSLRGVMKLAKEIVAKENLGASFSVLEYCIDICLTIKAFLMPFVHFHMHFLAFRSVNSSFSKNLPKS